MTPEAALETQIERYRQMSGEERLREGLYLNEIEQKNRRERIRKANPEFSKKDVENRLRQLWMIANFLHPT